VTSDLNSSEWQQLNKAVESICCKYGKESSASEQNDFEISRDNWGGVSQRVLVFKPKFLVPRLLQELSQSINKTKLIGAQIEVVFDFGGFGNASADFMRGLLIVHANGVDESFTEIEELRKFFGSWFYTDA
jgi:hypothetical protein